MQSFHPLMHMLSYLILGVSRLTLAQVLSKQVLASVALAFTRRGCYGWWGACLTDRAMTCVRWYVCSFCGKPWRFCDTLPPLLAYCLHLVPYNSVTRVRCQLEMPLPMVIFIFWFAVGFYLDFWWWVSWRPWAMCFWATELVEPRVNQTWDFDTVWILRWVGPRPFASRGAVISCGYFCLVCLEPMEHNHFGCYARGLRDFFGLQKIVIFQFFGYLPRIATLLCTLRCGVSHLNWCLCLG